MIGGILYNYENVEHDNDLVLSIHSYLHYL